MKKTITVLLCVLLLIITVCSCGNKPSCDFEYNIKDFEYFSQIFDDSDNEWETMGNYTILINGLDTPVVVRMDGIKVLSVTAYGNTAEVNIEPFQDVTPADIDGVKGTVIINETLDYSGRSWLLTKEGIHTFNPSGAISTQIFANEDGTICYTRYWGEYVSSFEQWDTAPLDLCDSREEFLYENGTVEIANSKVIMTPVKTVCVSDEFDLDTLFAQAKKDGMYGDYNTVDELLENNARKR